MMIGETQLGTLHITLGASTSRRTRFPSSLLVDCIAARGAKNSLTSAQHTCLSVCTCVYSRSGVWGVGS